MLVSHIKQPSHLLYSNLCRARTFWKTLLHACAQLNKFGGVSAFFHIFDVCPHTCSSCAHMSWKCCQVERRKPTFGELHFFWQQVRTELILRFTNFLWHCRLKGRTGSAYLVIKPKALDIQTPTNTRHKMNLTAVCKCSFLRHSNANNTQRRALKNLMKNQTYSWTETTCGP